MRDDEIHNVPNLPEPVLQALWKVLEYNMHDEMKHFYFEYEPKPGQPLSHIYLSLLTLEQWLNGDELIKPDLPEDDEERTKAYRRASGREDESAV